MPFCASCGAQHLEVAKFCQECGAKVERLPATGGPSGLAPLIKSPLAPLSGRPASPDSPDRGLDQEPSISAVSVEAAVMTPQVHVVDALAFGSAPASEPQSTSTSLSSHKNLTIAVETKGSADLSSGAGTHSERAPDGEAPDERAPSEIAPRDDGGSISAVADTAAAETASRSSGLEVTRRGVLRWRQFFRTEEEIVARFVEMVEKLIQLATPASNLREQIRSLNFALSKFRGTESASDRRNSNIFLVPAVQAAAVVIDYLILKAETCADAFWAANVFGEMSKILLDRARDKYQDLFGQLLWGACTAVGNLWEADPSRRVSRDSEGEVSLLQKVLNLDCCKPALGTYYDGRRNRFMTAGRPDNEIGEKVVSAVLARYFDKRLRSLLASDRPRVKEFATTNMPTVYRLNLPDSIAPKRKEWERLLTEAGYEDVIRFLKDMGDLVSAEEVGHVSPERRDDVRRAQSNNDHDRVAQLLKDSANELRSYLYKEAQRRLDYREPLPPHLTDRDQRSEFEKAKRLAESGDPQKISMALNMVENIWNAAIRNTDLREWVAYLRARSENLLAAEQMFESIRKRLDPSRAFATEWNLAVLAYNRKNEADAYQILLPLLDSKISDEDLVLVVLGLSLKSDDRTRFLSTVPQTMSRRFHPLAFVVALEMGDRQRAEEILGQLLQHWHKNWELPPASERLPHLDALDEIVNRAIVEGQLEQLLPWLRARIAYNRNWIPNYLALARVLEDEKGDLDGAFGALRSRVEVQRGAKQDFRRLEEACRELLEFCKRLKRKDLGQEAYLFAQDARMNEDLLNSFRDFAPGGNEVIPSPPPPPPPPAPPLPPISDPRLAEDLAWVTARLTNIRNVASHEKESVAIKKFVKILGDMHPHESGAVVQLIQDASTVIETFSRTKPENRDARRVLHDRATGFERRLAQLLDSGALQARLADIIAPYRVALEQVVGDLSRQSGVGPSILAVIENPFISPDASLTTLILRVTNQSERPVTDVLVEIHVESPFIAVVGKREQRIDKLGSMASHLFSIPIEQVRNANLRSASEISIGISLRASAEGYPNVDLGIVKKRIPVKSLLEVQGIDHIPVLFQAGRSLNPSEPRLFQGRADILTKIQRSFHGGIQRERYFLDGIRRVGKTSILNFLPQYLPEALVPVLVTFDNVGLQGPINSSQVLRHFAKLIGDRLVELGVANVALPDVSAFDAAPGWAFDEFLRAFRSALPGKVPFLMIDEFQDLLIAISRSGSGADRDMLVLDQMRGHLDTGHLFAVFTGSVRFDRLSQIVNHRIFGSLTRLRVSFLTKESVGSVLSAGMQEWAILAPETIAKIQELTGGGYPWLLQRYGAALIELLNQEHRTVSAPSDVDLITSQSVLCNDELFEHWWPVLQLGAEEERFMEKLLRKFPADQRVSTAEFLSDVHNREQPAFRRAFENLRACEVLDSTSTNVLRFSGTVLRQWLEQHMQDGQLKLPRLMAEQPLDRGQAGIVIDHENLLKSLERISVARGVAVPADKLDWFSAILRKLVTEAERRLGPQIPHKVTVAFWTRPQEARLLAAYFQHGFIPQQPEAVKMENAVDFKVADEVRRARERAMREGSTLSRVIIICGDGDLTHATRALVNDGVNVQIWGGSKSTSQHYIQIVGDENVVVLDDVSGL